VPRRRPQVANRPKWCGEDVPPSTAQCAMPAGGSILAGLIPTFRGLANFHELLRSQVWTKIQTMIAPLLLQFGARRVVICAMTVLRCLHMVWQGHVLLGCPVGAICFKGARPWPEPALPHSCPCCCAMLAALPSLRTGRPDVPSHGHSMLVC
jgi:hypothetical protein